MTDTPDDPLTRAFLALARVQGEVLPPAAADACQEANEALLAALDERKALVTAVDAAMTLVTVLDDYESATEDGDEERIAEMAAAGAAAEDALVDALNEVHALMTTEADLSGDAAHLAALDRFADYADDDAEDDASRAQAYRDAFDEEDRAKE